MRPNSSITRELKDLALFTSTLDLIHMENKLIKSCTQSNCEKITVAIILAEMKQRWDTCNHDKKSRAFFSRYNSFFAYCKNWIPDCSDTQCNQLVEIGRTIANLTAQCQEMDEIFILPASITEAIDLIHLPENIRLSAWQAYKHDGTPLPVSKVSLADNSNRIRETIQGMVDSLPNHLIAPIAPLSQEEIQSLLSQQPSIEDLSSMTPKAKKDLAQLFFLMDHQALTGQELDNYLIDRLKLVSKNTKVNP